MNSVKESRMVLFLSVLAVERTHLEVNIIEEIIKIAERTGAIVGFSQDERLQKIGPVVGLLRYK